ncbi:sterol desaturase family protein [Marinoscillum furvescens]|nr:sterol desaturase family protein [Marinoscillum furvescens]
MNIDPIILSIPLYFTLIAIELMIQLVRKRQIYRLNDAMTNISCGITQQITGAFIKVAMVGVYQMAFEYLAVFHLPNSWWYWLLLILGVDFCYYWGHRMSHEVNLFWGGHVVHHQSEDYNFSVALRQGSFQALWTFWFYLPLAILGFNTLDFLLVSALNTVYQFWIHTETIGKLPKPIEWIFNTPSHHRVHHGKNPKYIDKNHAGSLIIWDRIFGTFQEEEERPTYGITKPINTWNPIRANLQHYLDMARQLRETPGFFNKLKVTFYKPGWRPEILGGPIQVEEPNSDTYQKFNANTWRHLQVYLFFQFIAILGITSIFLFTRDQMNIVQQLTFGGFIIWSVAQFGVLLEQSKWQALEYLRLVACGILVYAISPSPYFFIPTIVLSIGSLVAFYLISRAPAPTIKQSIPH